MTLLYSNKTPDDIVYKDEWQNFERENSNLKVVHTITENTTGWNVITGRIDEAMIREFCNDLDNTLFYICGPPGMVDAMQGILKGMNITPQNVKVERFVGY